MKVKVLGTTDHKHIGEVYVIPELTQALMANQFAMKSTRFSWFGDICLIQNRNYTIKILKLED